MKIEVRNNTVVIDGYVNAVERLSKPLYSRTGRFVEKIKVGAFARALERNSDVKCLLNHDWNRVLGSTLTNVRLTEDNIGLRFNAVIDDSEVVNKALNRELTGFSFGFRDIDVENGVDNDSKLPLRNVKDLELYEVSILDRSKTPAYTGCLVEVRDDEEPINISDENEEVVELVTETTNEETPVEEPTEEVVETVAETEETPVEEPVEEVEETTPEDVENVTEETTDDKTIPSEDYFTKYKNLISDLKESVKQFE